MSIKIVGYSLGEQSKLFIPNVQIGGTNMYFKINHKHKNTIQCNVYVNHKNISFNNAMNYLQHNKKFRNKFINVLKNTQFDAYFLEIAPSNKPFEFTLVNAPILKNIQPDRNPFKNKLNKCKNKNIISFMNLSKTSKLIVPCPISNEKAYTHIANFIKYAPKKQIHLFLKQIPIQVKLFKKKYKIVWVNTHGLGVHWIHLRIDSKPKYYKTQKYIKKK